MSDTIEWKTGDRFFDSIMEDYKKIASTNSNIHLIGNWPENDFIVNDVVTSEKTFLVDEKGFGHYAEGCILVKDDEDLKRIVDEYYKKENC